MSLPPPTLHTDRLRLRPFADTDADALFGLQSNASVLRYWDAPPWTERGRAERFITACRQMAEEGTGNAAGGGPDVGRGVSRLVQPDPLEPRLPQRSDGLLLRGGSMGPRLRDRGGARPAAVGVRH